MSLPLSTPETNPDEWSIRGDYWINKLNPTPKYKARKRRKIHKPLVLSGHGIRLNVNAGTLLITCGFTHYPQKREEYRFFPGDRQLPSRIVILDGDGNITIDALRWLSEQGITLIQIDWKGEVSSVGGSPYAANPKVVRRQLAMQGNDEGLSFCRMLIQEKVHNSIETIKQLAVNAEDAQPMIESMEAIYTKLNKSPPKTLIDLLTLEGIAAAAYFRYWYTLDLCWRGIGRKPIPEEWKRIGTRIGKNGDGNQFAVHPVNAILNYAYAILANQIKGLIITAGADPSIGLMHSNTRSDAAFVYDLIEPARPIMDLKILKFVLGRIISPDDFILNKNGVVRLHPQMARYIVKLVQDVPEIENLTTANLKKLFNIKFQKK